VKEPSSDSHASKAAPSSSFLSRSAAASLSHVDTLVPCRAAAWRTPSPSSGGIVTENLSTCAMHTTISHTEVFTTSVTPLATSATSRLPQRPVRCRPQTSMSRDASCGSLPSRSSRRGLSIPACPARRRDKRQACSEEDIMHPYITKTIAALRVDDKHAAAAAARLARQARARRAAGSLPLPGSAAAAGGRAPVGSGCWDAGFPAGCSRPEQPARGVRREPAGGGGLARSGPGARRSQGGTCRGVACAIGPVRWVSPGSDKVAADLMAHAHQLGTAVGRAARTAGMPGRTRRPAA
jgi:hypothetical protein